MQLNESFDSHLKGIRHAFLLYKDLHSLGCRHLSKMHNCHYIKDLIRRH